MARLIASIVVLLLLGGIAEAKGNIGGGGSKACQGKSFDNCMAKCMSQGGKGGKSRINGKCADRCGKKC